MEINKKYIELVERYSGNSSQFFTALNACAVRLSIPLEWICNVIYIESGFNPKAKNPNSSASGLIQFMDATARGLGTTTAAILSMTNVQQIPYIERYFRNQIASVGKPKDWFDTYCLVFYPIWVKSNDDAVLSPAAYKANSYIDLNSDSKITKAEFRLWATRKLPNGIYETVKKQCPHCLQLL